ncbi:hypothetical protein GA0070618_6683 [Micromonospora echinospora]|uniref:Uncharacterized protein n=1 Tax=Micromonospora echinospora TaxID=1877 RepID=A0A1C4U4X5_MICEC|nr:hypothetical protein [Micromonospora echinospora]SCE66657.1 hypothetical protein GA0070618_0013 [Micromonospora echinospora]SCF42589.1 hypothetical protein GA0070618_6683 [Micromonospora echinospora]
MYFPDPPRRPWVYALALAGIAAAAWLFCALPFVVVSLILNLIGA